MRTERHQPDYILMIAVLMLTGIGIVTVYSASTVIQLHSGSAADYYAVRQLGAAIFGLLLFALTTYMPYHIWYKHAPKLLLISTLLLLVVLVPGVGHRALGATRWLGTSSIHLQPSAVAVVVIVIYLSFLLTRKMTVIHDWRRSFRPAMMVIVMMTILIIIEPDMGTSMAFFATALVLLFASGIRLRPIILTLVVMLPAAYLMAHLASYRKGRLDAFMHPFSNASRSGGGYQLVEGLTGIVNGGLTGRGFDLSVMATGYLPESYTDFIFAVFTEQWGWLGDAGLLAIFAVLVWRGFRIARYAPSRFGALMAIGLTSTIVIQAAINLGAVTWLIPVTGIPLPFISYGGTAIVINLFSMGILMSISRETGDTVTDVDSLADVVSVEQFRAERSSVGGSASIPGTGRPAKVASLTRHRAGSWQNERKREQTRKTDNRRNISLTWKAQQNKPVSGNNRKNARNNDYRNNR
ncbi:FtsW/RodA/SpoVE family cell cycle protein [Alicyclobacillus dauci]|uniref:Probable peptidoglycan glycosyltransferase FtsW n=1 Tax=Alicyclobacillus dauci TaxID=1475485 RepID=A0ABY6YYN2_9BACL|nr:putative peptidoglycan glycosyltransferase FtsW [Alicyclobacillus dauci]WAH35742.1 putative lipid II flippase FtsW [Alicyclobacillus dauci]